MAEVKKIRVGGLDYNLSADISVADLEEKIQGSDTIVVDENEAGDGLEVHLDSEIVEKVNRALVLPVSTPSTTMLVGVTTANAQTNINPTSLTVGGLVKNTTAPTSANTDGIKVVVLTEEPTTKYDGYIYIITEA